MNQQVNEEVQYEAVCLIVNANVGSRVLQIAKQDGSSGGTICYGRGTINNEILKMFGLEDIRKEIVIMAIQKTFVTKVMDILAKKLKLNKPNNGIAFSAPIINIIGNRDCTYYEGKKLRAGDKNMHQAIITIVDQGQAEEVMEAAAKVGSKGGTVISGRGSGTHETMKLFSMDVEPEKDIVLILSKNEETDAIVKAINSELKIDQPGKGVLFTIQLSDTLGLF